MNTVYPTGSPELWVLFDLRDESAVKSLHLQRTALREYGDLEHVDEDHAVLIARPGGARSREL